MRAQFLLAHVQRQHQLVDARLAAHQLRVHQVGRVERERRQAAVERLERREPFYRHARRARGVVEQSPLVALGQTAHDPPKIPPHPVLEEVLVVLGPISEHDSTQQNRRRLLLDAYGMPVAGMERMDLPPNSAEYTVIAGGGANKAVFCAIKTCMIGQAEPPFVMMFTDPVSGKPMIISAKGYWQTRDAVITITTDERHNDAVYCLVRIYCEGNPLDGAFCMDVAAGVDVALMVLVAAAMEEQSKNHERTPDRLALRKAAKRWEKKQASQKKHAQAAAAP